MLSSSFDGVIIRKLSCGQVERLSRLFLKGGCHELGAGRNSASVPPSFLRTSAPNSFLRHGELIISSPTFRIPGRTVIRHPLDFYSLGTNEVAVAKREGAREMKNSASHRVRTAQFTPTFACSGPPSMSLLESTRMSNNVH